MQNKDIENILSETKTIRTNGHYVGQSGVHYCTYIDKYRINMHPDKLALLAEEIAMQCKKLYPHIDIVAAPALGAVPLGNLVAYFLHKMNYTPLSIIVDKKGGILPVDKDIVLHKNVLVIEDTLNTGGSALKAIDAIKESGGNVIGLFALCNRGQVKSEHLNIPKLHALIDLDLPKWTQEDCPLCKENIPINIEVGHGKKLIA